MNDPGMSRLERGLHGGRVNMFAAGAVGALIGLAPDDVRAAVGKIFEDKGDKVVAANAAGAELAPRGRPALRSN